MWIVYQQVVYDKNGQLVTDPNNKFSYDYEEPSISNLYRNHLTVDVDPWLELGNTPQDTTTKEQRIEAMSKTVRGRLGLIELGYHEDNTGKWVKKVDVDPSRNWGNAHDVETWLKRGNTPQDTTTKEQ